MPVPLSTAAVKPGAGKAETDPKAADTVSLELPAGKDVTIELARK
jgi:hypothetical protein